ncbi:MAG: 16S rRNA (adenine(1518)-N(6)/adenine(1519)-N(6))-dimethyltransferase RsmA [Acidobacteriota bacterium]
MPQAKKTLGQHFLTDQNYCRRIVDYARIEPDDIIVEIGPGTGQLTELLVRKAARVVALEFDRDMIFALHERFEASIPDRLSLIQADVLQFDWPALPIPGGFKLVGNLPYNISTRILRKSIDVKNRMKLFAFMVQKEVAERVRALPGSRDYGYFSVLMDYHFERRPGFDVPPGAFFPRPKVMSHVMMLVPKAPADPVPDLQAFEQLLGSCFAHPRKTLWNNLSSAGYPPEQVRKAFEAAGIEPKARPGHVSVGQYACLSRML